MVFDLGRCGFGIGIVPGSIFVDLPIDDNIVVARFTFPWASGMRGALLKIFSLNRLRREIVVAFDDYRIVALCQNGVVPGRLHECMSRLNRVATKHRRLRRGEL